MSPSVRLIEKPSDAQIEEVVDVLLRAFDGDESADAMTGGNNELRPQLFRSMLRAGALAGHFYVVSDDSDKILTIGLWFGPGQMMFSTEEQRKQGWEEYFASLKPETQTWWTQTFHEKHEQNLQALLGDKYLNGWFANVIATDPEHQRKGYASLLTQTVCERAKKEHYPVALATQNEKNKLWYESLGFKTVGAVQIPAETGAWPDYFLLWEGSE